jgi:hypothetical protein
MSRTVAKKPVERRRKPRSSAAGQSAKAKTRRASGKADAERRPLTRKAPASSPEVSQESCMNCAKDLSREDRALFVEEEIGRVFCSEDCIAAYFAPEVERLEKEYFKHLASSDLSPDEREKLAHLRWITLQEADEVWREKTLSGDHRYTLISEFTPSSKPVWSVCICLFLRGEPSFLYLAFTTRNGAMVNHYRRGERIEWIRPAKKEDRPARATADGESDGEAIRMDGLADEWTEEETLRASLSGPRRADDIPVEDYPLYNACTEETLHEPDEVWRVSPSGEDGPHLYHFIREYPDEKPGFWFVVVARETSSDDEEIEILDLFPTRDAELVQRFRQGNQEVGSQEPASPSRLVH